MPAAIYLRKDLAGLLIEIICFTSVSSSKYCSYIWYSYKNARNKILPRYLKQSLIFPNPHLNQFAIRNKIGDRTWLLRQSLQDRAIALTSGVVLIIFL